MSAAPHPDTVDLAKRLIDELQHDKYHLHQCLEYHVSLFLLKMMEMLGTSDSEAVSEYDFPQMKGGSSEGDESDQSSGEDVYSSQH